MEGLDDVDKFVGNQISVRFAIVHPERQYQMLASGQWKQDRDHGSVHGIFPELFLLRKS